MGESRLGSTQRVLSLSVGPRGGSEITAPYFLPLRNTLRIKIENVEKLAVSAHNKCSKMLFAVTFLLCTYILCAYTSTIQTIFINILLLILITTNVKYFHIADEEVA